ncbi:MAG: hypothetical protein ABLT11_06535, partial [Candidatus Acidiferrum sp.]
MKASFQYRCGFQRGIFSGWPALTGVLAITLFASATVLVAAMPGPDAMAPASLDPPVTPHTSVERSGKFETKNGLTLRLTADLGSVRIITLETGGAPTVRYTMHVETDARGPQAQSLLEKYV